MEFHIFIHWFHLISWFIGFVFVFVLIFVWISLAHAEMKWSNYVDWSLVYEKKQKISLFLTFDAKEDEPASACAFTFMCLKKSIDLFQCNMIKLTSKRSLHFQHKVSFVVLFPLCLSYWWFFYRSIRRFIVSFNLWNTNELETQWRIWKRNETQWRRCKSIQD